MSATIALTGDDVVKINGRHLTQLADGNVAELTFPNDLTAVKTGKNGNALYALNASGRQGDVTIRVVRGSADDAFLNNLFALMRNNLASFALLQGELNKQIGDGAGGIKNDIYVLGGGVFKKAVEGKQNVEGDTEQAVSVYTLAFADVIRTIG